MRSETKQREIKFRAYDTKAKRWLCGYETLGGFSLMGECVIFGEWASQLGPIDQWNDVVIMQYTGLKDKNGKEIYEGDIVQRGVIVFSNGKFQGQYFGSGGMYETWEDDLYIERNIEVLGNIYQNPELLNPES